MFTDGFTVLMAVYGRDDALLFDRAIESVYANTLRPTDFVLVVDGPVPPSVDAVISRHSALHGVRTVRLRRNVGLSKALNRGLSVVRTPWIVRADADDLNVPDRFEKQADAIRRAAGAVDLIGGAILEVDRAGRPIAIRDVPRAHDAIVTRLATRNPFNHMTVAYRTVAAVAVGGYPAIHLKEDYALWASMIAGGARCANLADVLVRATAGRDMYRRRGGVDHARSELALQRHLRRLGHKGPLAAVLHGSLRAGVSLIPASARGWLYERALRRPAPAPRA